MTLRLPRRLSALALGTALAVQVVVGSSVAGLWAETIGFVDFPQLMSKFNGYQSLLAEKRLREADLKKLQADLERQLEESRKTNANNPLATKQLQEQLQKQFDGKLQEYQNWLIGKEGQLDKQIKGSIESARKAKLVDIVLDKGAVFAGGVDLTTDVLTSLNSGGGAAPAAAKPVAKPAGK